MECHEPQEMVIGKHDGRDIVDCSVAHTVKHSSVNYISTSLCPRPLSRDISWYGLTENLQKQLTET